MPELPDVESFRRHIAPAVHQRVLHADVSAPEMVKGLSATALRNHLEEHRIEETQRIGKHLLLKLDGGWLDLHFGTSGHPQYLDHGAPLPPYTRMALRLDHGTLAYVVPRRLGRISWVESPKELVEQRNLGPDALDPRLDFERFSALARGKGTIKCWLMDQSQIAGIGNVYSDEILYHARIHPKRRAGDLSEEELRRLFRTMHTLFAQAVAHDADPAQLSDWLLSHRRAGRPCPRCKGKVERISLCGRSAYFCPSCQHLP